MNRIQVQGDPHFDWLFGRRADGLGGQTMRKQHMVQGFKPGHRIFYSRRVLA